MNKNNLIKFIFLFIFVFFSTNLQSSINNSIIISVGNSPITSLDLLKEMKLISFVTKNKINDSNKEQIKQMAVQSLIKRKIKEIEITKYEINNYNAKDLENMIERTSRNLGVDKNGLAILMRNNNLNIKNLEDKYKIDLKWNTLIFELYKNKISLNMSDIEKKNKFQIRKIGF